MLSESLRILDLISNCNIPVIAEDVKFWMLRPKEPYFTYSDGVIAVHRNDPNGSEATSKKKNMMALFLNDVNKGDYVIIPSTKQSQIYIGLVGELIEQDNGTYSRFYERIKEISLKTAGTRNAFAIYGKEGFISLDEYVDDVGVRTISVIADGRNRQADGRCTGVWTAG